MALGSDCPPDGHGNPMSTHSVRSRRVRGRVPPLASPGSSPRCQLLGRGVGREHSVTNGHREGCASSNRSEHESRAIGGESSPSHVGLGETLNLKRVKDTQFGLSSI